MEEGGVAIDGRWTVTVNTPMGEQISALTLRTEEGGRLQGEQVNNFGSVKLEDGRVDGDRASWTVKLAAPFPITLTVEATVAGDVLTGQVTAGQLGVSPMTGVRTG